MRHCGPRESQDLRQKLRPRRQPLRTTRNALHERRLTARWNLPQPAQLYRSDRSRRLEAQTSLVVSCKRNLCVRSWRLIPSRHRSCSATLRPSPRRKSVATCPAALGGMGKPRAIKNSAACFNHRCLHPPNRAANISSRPRSVFLLYRAAAPCGQIPFLLGCAGPGSGPELEPRLVSTRDSHHHRRRFGSAGRSWNFGSADRCPCRGQRP